MIKFCSKCKEEKQYPEDFRKGKKQKDGSYFYLKYCKKCRNKKECEYNLQNGKVKTPRGMPVESLINKQFGKLLVIKYDGKKIYGKHNRHLWLCKCECGIEKVIKEDSLKTGNTKSCGCSKRKTGKDNHCYKGYEKITGRFWSSIQQSAKVRNLDFNITIEYIWDLFNHQNGKCKISRSYIYFGSSKNTASLDRIDSKKGYIKGNVQWVHKIVNQMKWDSNQEEFIQWCKQIANNNS